MAITQFDSPLRYPGGKRKLVAFMKLLFEENGLGDRHYVEPYCGGSAVGLALLFGEYAEHIHINDVSRSVYAFWHTVLNRTDDLCERIRATPVTMREWRRQQRVFSESASSSVFDLGFSTFFLNRTNRSGILGAGVIGGKKQQGEWRLSARFNKTELIRRVQKIARYRDRICLYNLDACEFLTDICSNLPDAFAYLDPPYYGKGDALYENWYSDEDHAIVAALARELPHDWIVTYDRVPAILDLYSGCRSLRYSLSYSAQNRFRGDEVMFLSDTLRLPSVLDHAQAAGDDVDRYTKVGSLRFAAE